MRASKANPTAFRPVRLNRPPRDTELRFCDFGVELEDSLGIRLNDEEALACVSNDDLLNLVVSKRRFSPEIVSREARCQLEERALAQVRRDLARVLDVEAKAISASDDLNRLFPTRERKARWARLRAVSHFYYPELSGSRRFRLWLNLFFLALFLMTVLLVWTTTSVMWPDFEFRIGVFIAILLPIGGVSLLVLTLMLGTRWKLIEAHFFPGTPYTVETLGRHLTLMNLTALHDELFGKSQLDSEHVEPTVSEKNPLPDFWHKVAFRVTVEKLKHVCEIPAEALHPETPLADLIPRTRARDQWNRLQSIGKWELPDLRLPPVLENMSSFYQWILVLSIFLAALFLTPFLLAGLLGLTLAVEVELAAFGTVAFLVALLILRVALMPAGRFLKRHLPTELETVGDLANEILRFNQQAIEEAMTPEEVETLQTPDRIDLRTVHWEILRRQIALYRGCQPSEVNLGDPLRGFY